MEGWQARQGTRMATTVCCRAAASRGTGAELSSQIWCHTGAPHAVWHACDMAFATPGRRKLLHLAAAPSQTCSPAGLCALLQLALVGLDLGLPVPQGAQLQVQAACAQAQWTCVEYERVFCTKIGAALALGGRCAPLQRRSASPVPTTPCLVSLQLCSCPRASLNFENQLLECKLPVPVSCMQRSLTVSALAAPAPPRNSKHLVDDA